MVEFKRHFLSRTQPYDKELAKKFLALTKEGVTAAFIYSSNVAARGEVKPYDEKKRKIRTLMYSGKIYVPTSLFSDCFGVAVTEGASEITLSLGEYSVRTERKKVSGTAYVPALVVAEALGIFGATAFEGRLLLLGDRDAVLRVANDKELSRAASYVVIGDIGEVEFTKEDFRIARENWKSRLVGTPETNDLSNPSVRAKIDLINAETKRTWESMNKSMDAVKLWGDTPPVESGELSSQYGGIATLAKGYATYGSDYYKDPELLSDIKLGLEWMYENMYGESIIEDRGWRDPRLFNWWFWYIGGPEHLTDVLIMLDGEISLEDRRRYLRCFEWISTWMFSAQHQNHAGGRISVCTKVGLVLEDSRYIVQECDDVDYFLELREDGAGARVDYSDFAHNFPYNLGYGRAKLERVMIVCPSLMGTPLEFKSPLQYNLFGMARYMFEPALYRGQGMMMFQGRSTFASESASCANILICLLPMVGMFGEDEDCKLKKLIKRNSALSKVRDTVRKGCSLYLLSLYESILEDDSISYGNDYEYAHSWYTADRAAQQRNNYAIGIALNSKREMNYESINSANKTGWYTGDGAQYLYTDYDDAEFDGHNFIMHNINVAYRFPGTTEDERERAIRSISGGYAYKPENAYSGSVSLYGKLIAAAMDFRSMNFEGPDSHPDDAAYGGTHAVHLNDLKSKKAWFCFDDEIVCLSAGITSTMDSPVNTTIDHRRVRYEDKFLHKIGVGECVETLPLASGRRDVKNPDFVLIEGHAGYLFLEGADVYYNRYVNVPKNFSNSEPHHLNSADGKPEQTFFEIGISHGKNPKADSYAYVIIPYATEDKLRVYKSSPDVTVLANSDVLAAAYEKNTNTAGIAFYEGGECKTPIVTVTASAPSLVMLGESFGVLELAIADVTQESGIITYTLDGEYELVEKTDDAECVAFGGKTVIVANHKDAHGRIARIKFKA